MNSHIFDLSLKNNLEDENECIANLIIELKNLDISKGKSIIGKSHWGKLNGYRIEFSLISTQIYKGCEINLDICIFDKNELIFYKSKHFTQYGVHCYFLTLITKNNNLFC